MIAKSENNEKEAMRVLESARNPMWIIFKKKLQRDYEETLDFVLRNGGEIERGQAQYARHLLDEIKAAVNDTGQKSSR
jgi:hypothetical protein